MKYQAEVKALASRHDILKGAWSWTGDVDETVTMLREIADGIRESAEQMRLIGASNLTVDIGYGKAVVKGEMHL